MTTLKHSILLSFVYLFISATSFAQVDPAPPEEGVLPPCETEVDEFTQQEKSSCDPVEIVVEEQPRERIYVSRGILAKTGEQAYLLFYVVSESWNFLRAETAYVIIDGENFEFPFERVDNETRSGRVEEQNAIRLDDSDLETLSSASEFRVKVGQAVFSLPTSELSEHASFMLGN